VGGIEEQLSRDPHRVGTRLSQSIPLPLCRAEMWADLDRNAAAGGLVALGLAHDVHMDVVVGLAVLLAVHSFPAARVRVSRVGDETHVANKGALSDAGTIWQGEDGAQVRPVVG